MDSETGETLTELLYSNNLGDMVESTVDNETGEEEAKLISLDCLEKKKFKVPLYYYKKLDEHKSKENCDHCYTNDHTSCILFLLPTLFAFTFPVAACFISVLEIIMHIKAHKYNRMFQPDKFVFHSPLHIVTSQFCSSCRLENCGEKFSQLHKRFLRHSKKWYSVLS